MLTPAMQQFYDLKEQNPDSILWFRMGDFYEMFWDDAVKASKILWINLTTRNKNATNPEPLAWIPYHAKDKYLPGLVNAWCKVAIAEQVSDPKLKWIVKREVVRIVTPATLNLEWETYATQTDENYIVSIYEEKGKFWLSFLESNSWIWKTWEVSNLEKLSKEIYKILPTKIILDKKLFWNEKITEIFSKKFSLNIYYFESQKNAYSNMIKHFQVKNLEWFNLEGKKLAQKASSNLLEYLELNQKTSLSHLNKISFESFSAVLDLDESTIKNLDLLYNFATNSKSWTLLSVLDKTNTSMWKRFLREAIIKPLTSEKEINDRLSIIEEILSDTILLDKINSKLRLVSDLDNILTRLSLWRANPRDLINLKNSLITILEVFDLIKKDWSEKLNKMLNINP